jgi:hypothetical protein
MASRPFFAPSQFPDSLVVAGVDCQVAQALSGQESSFLQQTDCRIQRIAFHPFSAGIERAGDGPHTGQSVRLGMESAMGRIFVFGATVVA